MSINNDKGLDFARGCMWAIGISVLIWMAIMFVMTLDIRDTIRESSPVPVSQVESASEVSDEVAATANEVYRMPALSEPDFEPLPSDDHPYNVYSDDELRTMSVSDPAAAILLARRTENADAAELMYERAVALGGHPAVLHEWLLDHHPGIASRTGSELDDVEGVMLGYEVFLTMMKFDTGQEGVELYGSILREEGVDLEPIRQRAERRYERMTRERQALLGQPWEQRT